MKKVLIFLTVLMSLFIFNACKSNPDLSGKWVSQTSDFTIELDLKNGSNDIYNVYIYSVIRGKKYREKRAIGKFEDDIIHINGLVDISFFNDNQLGFNNNEFHRVY